ncbi:MULTISPECIES: hypothetical protein [Kocuria]|uniref:GHMP family kinase ATP-binding protein n=1 Tax=Kocuria TaxID=57493 RepID=UPI0013870303
MHGPPRSRSVQRGPQRRQYAQWGHNSPRIPTGDRLWITSPIQPGCGLGSATAEVVASIRAMSSACGVRVGAREISRLPRRAESAEGPRRARRNARAGHRHPPRPSARVLRA